MLGDSTFAVVPINRRVQAWLALHAELIRRIAAMLQVPATSVAAPLVQEAGGIIFDADTPASMFSAAFLTAVIDDPLRSDSLGPYRKQSVDKWADDRVQGYNHREIAQDYVDKYSEIAGAPDAVRSAPRSWIEKLTSPTANDLGWSNVSLGTAIRVLDRYLADPRYAGDPLHLKRSQSDDKTFAADLIDPHGDASFAISGLVAQQARSYFDETYGDAYRSVPDQAKAALTTTYFKQGDAATRRHFVDPIAPALPDPMQGDGGPDIMDTGNWDTLLKSLSVPPDRRSERHANGGPIQAPFGAALPALAADPRSALDSISKIDLDAGDTPLIMAPADFPLPGASSRADVSPDPTSNSPLVDVRNLSSASGGPFPGIVVDPPNIPARNLATEAASRGLPRLEDGFNPAVAIDSPAVGSSAVDFAGVPEAARWLASSTGGTGQARPLAEARPSAVQMPSWLGGAARSAEPTTTQDWPALGPMPNERQVSAPGTPAEFPEFRPAAAALGPSLASARFAPDVPGGAAAPGNSVAPLSLPALPPVRQSPDFGAGLPLPLPSNNAGDPLGWSHAAETIPHGDGFAPSSGSTSNLVDRGAGLGEMQPSISTTPGLAGLSPEDQRDASSRDAPAWPARGRIQRPSNSRRNPGGDDNAGASSSGANATPSAAGGAQITLPGSAERPMEIELDGHAFGTALASALERMVGGPNTGPASVNSSQIYTPAGVNISGLQ